MQTNRVTIDHSKIDLEALKKINDEIEQLVKSYNAFLLDESKMIMTHLVDAEMAVKAKMAVMQAGFDKKIELMDMALTWIAEPVKLDING